MPIQDKQNADDRTEFRQMAIALGAISLAIAGGIGIVFAVRRLNRPDEDGVPFDVPAANEQAITVNAPFEAVESAWIDWCAQGHLKLKHDYAVRFEPAPGARGTEVHLVGGGSTGTIRDVLRRFKQQLETGEVPITDGPDLSRPAQPRVGRRSYKVAEVER